jgi:hypothetical protein
MNLASCLDLLASKKLRKVQKNIVVFLMLPQATFSHVLENSEKWGHDAHAHLGSMWIA